VMHPALQHHTRRDNRDPGKWNEACDDVINPRLRECGFTLPEGVRPGVDEDVSAETLYARYAKRAPENASAGKPGKGSPSKGSGAKPGKGNGNAPAGGKPAGPTGKGATPGNTSPGNAPAKPGPGGSDPGGCGEVRDAPAGDPSAAAKWKVATQQAARYAKSCGNLPGSLERLVAEVLEPRVPWRDALRRFVDRNARSDYRWSPANRRHVWRGCYLPSCRSDQLPELVVAIDTSCSIGPAVLDQFAAELSAILEQYPTTAHVIYCDARVQGSEEFSSDDLPIELHPKGGGGTAFAPVWDEVEERGLTPCCCVYLTDLESYRFGEAPSYPVLWAKLGNWPHEPPFGEVVAIGDEA